MIFNKKRVFLYGSILILLLISVYFVNSAYLGRTAQDSRGFVTTNTTTFGEGRDSITGKNLSYTELANWTRGGNIEVFQFNLTIASDNTLNISHINITLPTTGFSNITIYLPSLNTSNQFG